MRWRDADGAQRLGQAQQMVVVRPDQVAGLDDRLQGVGKQLVDAAVAGELRPFELAQADLVVQHRPQRAVGEAAVEFVVVAAGQIDGDQGDRPDGMFGGARWRLFRSRRSSRTRRRLAASARRGHRRRGRRRWARLPGWGRRGWRRRPGGTTADLTSRADFETGYSHLLWAMPNRWGGARFDYSAARVCPSAHLELARLARPADPPDAAAPIPAPTRPPHSHVGV